MANGCTVRQSTTTIVCVLVLLPVHENVVEEVRVFSRHYYKFKVFGTERTLFPHLVSKVRSLCRV